MHRIFRKDQVLTIPNLLSVIRLALIPLIVWLYIGKQEYSAAVAVILISGATDIIDGFIARKFNMVSDLGKILDPVADKLTQATVILCLTVKYRWKDFGSRGRQADAGYGDPLLDGEISLDARIDCSLCGQGDHYGRARVYGNSKERCC